MNEIQRQCIIFLRETRFKNLYKNYDFFVFIHFIEVTYRCDFKLWAVKDGHGILAKIHMPVHSDHKTLVSIIMRLYTLYKYLDSENIKLRVIS